MEAMRVLLVDDEEELVTTLAERLKIRGIEATAVTSGKEALDRIAAGEFDVVLLDVKMPGLGGIDVLRQIKNQQPRLPVILITGHVSSEDGEAGTRQGAFDCVVKPVNIDVLIGKMREAVAKGRGGR